MGVREEEEEGFGGFLSSGFLFSAESLFFFYQMGEEREAYSSPFLGFPSPPCTPFFLLYFFLIVSWRKTARTKKRK